MGCVDDGGHALHPLPGVVAFFRRERAPQPGGHQRRVRIAHGGLGDSRRAGNDMGRQFAAPGVF
jgi:hypothetical protein